MDLNNLQRVLQRIQEIKEKFNLVSPNYQSNFQQLLTEQKEILSLPKTVLGDKTQAKKTYSISSSELINLVERLAEKHQMDKNLIKAVISAESDFNQWAVSNKGAKGLMQLMPQTARALGVKNTFDPYQNIDAGIRYLKELIGRFSGNIHLALAAYNAGPGAVEHYGGIPPYKETKGYVQKVIRLWEEYARGNK